MANLRNERNKTCFEREQQKGARLGQDFALFLHETLERALHRLQRRWRGSRVSLGCGSMCRSGCASGGMRGWWEREGSLGFEVRRREHFNHVSLDHLVFPAHQLSDAFRNPWVERLALYLFHVDLFGVVLGPFGIFILALCRSSNNLPSRKGEPIVAHRATSVLNFGDAARFSYDSFMSPCVFLPIKHVCATLCQEVEEGKGQGALLEHCFLPL